MQGESPALIALGSNLPLGKVDPAGILRRALADMSALGLRPLAVSRFFRTPCFPAGAGPDYVNAAAVVDCGALAPEAVLAALHRIEALHGRERLARWSGRTLDLDLLAMGGQVRPDAATQAAWRDLAVREQALRAPDRLILPHPRMQDRAFVLVPLCDVAPDWRHPLVGLSVAEMAARLPPADRAGVTPI